MPNATLAERFLTEAIARNGYDAAPLRRCTNARVPKPGRFECELTVTSELTNAFGTLHGGAIATVVDVLTTAALLSTNETRGGVSTDLSCSYVAPAERGCVVSVRCDVVKTGKTLAWMDCVITRVDDGGVIATGRHTKFLPVGGGSSGGGSSGVGGHAASASGVGVGVGAPRSKL